MLAAEAEAVDITHRTDHFTLVFREVSLTAILYQEEFVAVGDRAQCRHVARVAKKMHGNDCTGSGRNLGLDVGRIQRVSVVDVREYRHTVMEQSADDAAPGCPGGDDDLVARIRINRADASMHRRSARGHRNNMGDTVARRELSLKLRYLRPFSQCT